jgi:hypothetical protein
LDFSQAEAGMRQVLTAPEQTFFAAFFQKRSSFFS